MKELERREAVVLTIELWSWLKETGGKKEDWPGWDKNGGEHSSTINSLCFLCEYVVQKEGGYSPSFAGCDDCPSREMFGYCANEDSAYWHWSEAKDIEYKKYWAGQFLNLLKEVLATMPKKVGIPKGSKWGARKEKPKQYLVFDDDGCLTRCGGGDLDDEVVEGDQALIELLEELAEDNPDTIKKFKVFKIEPVCFKAQPAKEVTVTLDC